MDELHQQVATLDRKLDSLYQAIESLTQRIAVEEASNNGNSGSASRGSTPSKSRDLTYHNGFNSDLIYGSEEDYKELILDDSNPESANPTGSRQLTPEIQIQRLMAQLTAAYNRIADLEEQLLSRRIH
ncbi:MAG: hypothetical protein AAGF75_05215 [Cyanobacteria bacterium P01_H01_bin.130]